MATKRPPDDDVSLASKIQRVEHADPLSPQHRPGNNDFSGSVKKKLADSKRTGQACDRCKVRTWTGAGQCRIACREWPIGLFALLDLRDDASTVRPRLHVGGGGGGCAAAAARLQACAHRDVTTRMQQERPRPPPDRAFRLYQHVNTSHADTNGRYARSAAMAVPKAARPASRTGRRVAPPTASQDAPPSEAMPRPWNRRTRTCAPRLQTSSRN